MRVVLFSRASGSRAFDTILHSTSGIMVHTIHTRQREHMSGHEFEGWRMVDAERLLHSDLAFRLLFLVNGGGSLDGLEWCI